MADAPTDNPPEVQRKRLARIVTVEVLEQDLDNLSRASTEETVLATASGAMVSVLGSCLVGIATVSDAAARAGLGSGAAFSAILAGLCIFFWARRGGDKRAALAKLKSSFQPPPDDPEGPEPEHRENVVVTASILGNSVVLLDESSFDENGRFRIQPIYVRSSDLIVEGARADDDTDSAD